MKILVILPNNEVKKRVHLVQPATEKKYRIINDEKGIQGSITAGKAIS